MTRYPSRRQKVVRQDFKFRPQAMKTIRYFLLCSFILFSFAACDKPADEVVWGVYCGECETNCSTVYQIKQGKLHVDKSDKVLDAIWNKDLPRYKFEGRQLSKDEYLKYEWVLGGVPQELFKYEQVIGKPDVHDQCGYFLRIFKAGKETNKLIDPEAVPKDIQEFVYKLFTL